MKASFTIQLSNILLRKDVWSERLTGGTRGSAYSLDHSVAGRYLEGFVLLWAFGQLPFARMFECAPGKALLSIENSIVKVLILLEEVTQWFSTLITG